ATLKLEGRAFYSLGITGDVITDAHSVGINIVLQIVTIPPSTGNLSIPRTVDGTACIAFNPGRPMILYQRCSRWDHLTLDFKPEPIETMFVGYLHRGTAVYIHAVDHMSAHFCLYDEWSLRSVAGCQRCESFPARTNSSICFFSYMHSSVLCPSSLCKSQKLLLLLFSIGVTIGGAAGTYLLRSAFWIGPVASRTHGPSFASGSRFPSYESSSCYHHFFHCLGDVLVQAFCQLWVVYSVHKSKDPHALRSSLHTCSFCHKAFHKILNGFFIPLFDVMDFQWVLDVFLLLHKDREGFRNTRESYGDSFSNSYRDESHHHHMKRRRDSLYHPACQEVIQAMESTEGDIDNFLKNGKLEQVVGIVKSCSLNVIEDLTVTIKDLSGTIPGTIHYKVIREGGYGNDITVGAAMKLVNVFVFTSKPSMHYLNITKKNMVKVFCKDTVLASRSG
nr:hypothetical protein [Tanacetum cinerariifolium]